HRDISSDTERVVARCCFVQASNDVERAVSRHHDNRRSWSRYLGVAVDGETVLDSLIQTSDCGWNSQVTEDEVELLSVEARNGLLKAASSLNGEVFNVSQTAPQVCDEGSVVLD